MGWFTCQPPPPGGTAWQGPAVGPAGALTRAPFSPLGPDGPGRPRSPFPPCGRDQNGGWDQGEHMGDLRKVSPVCLLYPTPTHGCVNEHSLPQPPTMHTAYGFHMHSSIWPSHPKRLYLANLQSHKEGTFPTPLSKHASSHAAHPGAHGHVCTDTHMWDDRTHVGEC